MSRLILSQITIKKERSISSTTWYYLLQPSNASAPDPTNYGSPPPTITTTGYSGWSTTEPTYTIGDDRILYIMVQTNYTDGTYSYSTPTISSSYEAAKQTYQEIIDAQEEINELSELGLKEGHFWYNTTEIPAGTFPIYPIGAYAASGLSSPTFNTKNSNSYGVNTWFSTQGLKIRYNAIPLAELSSSELAFYYPSTTVSSAKKAISLGIDNAVTSLRFYGFNNNSPDAILTSNGLKLVKGGIEGGNYSSSSTNFIYLSTNDYNGSPTITINGNNSGWRQIIGSKFGVKNDGTLYASNVNIEGTITATSLIINGNQDGIQAITDATTNAVSAKETAEGVLVYDHTYTVQKSGEDITSVTFTAHVYRGGREVTSEFTDDKFTWYYKNEDTADEHSLNNNILNDPQNSGKTITISNSTPVTLSILKYGVEIIGKFNTGEVQRLLRSNGDTLTDNNDRNLLGVTSETGNAIKVRELPEISSIETTDKLMIIGSTTENLVNISTIFASPALTGIPTAPTAASSTNNSQIATTAFVKNVVSALTNKEKGFGYGTCSTSASEPAKTVTCGSYKLLNGGIIAVFFTNGTSSLRSLNVNGTGIRYVRYRNIVATSSSTVGDSIAANCVAYFVYNGSEYVLLNWQHTNANSNRAGYMSTSMYTKLNGIETNADVTSVTPILTTGTSIATINGTTIYAPDGGVGNVEDVLMNGTSILVNGIANITNFIGATTSNAGTGGLVPAPPIKTNVADVKALGNDGTWLSIAPYFEQPTEGNYASQITLTIGGATQSIPTASITNDGMMSAADKIKLNAITYTGVSDIQINNTSILTAGIANIEYASSSQAGVIRIQSTTITPNSYILNLYYGDNNNNYYSIPRLYNNTISSNLLPLATSSQAGILSASDKEKLDSLEPLVSGETIKTINGNSLLGSGNLVISGGSGSESTILYGTCNTASGIAEKVVTFANGSLDSVSTGTQIVVKFTNYNYASNPYLSIDGINDIYIKKYGTTAPGTTTEMSWQSGSTISFTYDGTYWQMNNWLNTNTTYSPMSESLAISGIGTASYLITSTILKKAITHHAYPIGSIFETTTNVHPNTILYGRWRKISQPPIDTVELITNNDTSIITNSNNNLEVGFVLTNKWVRIS